MISAPTLVALALAMQAQADAALPEPSPVASAVPPREAGKHRVVVLPLDAVKVDRETADRAAELIADALGSHGDMLVMTTSDLKQLLSAQQLQQALTCESNTACMADVSRGLDADLLIAGSVGHVGSALTLSVSALDPAKGKVLNRRSISAASVRELVNAIPRLVLDLMGWTGGDAHGQYTLPAGKASSFAVMDLEASGVSADVTNNLTQVLSAEIKSVEGTSVISRSDVAALLQMESDKYKLGCDDASCLAEIGGALGVDYLVAGSIGRMAGTYVTSLRLISVRGTRVESRVNQAFSGSEDQLIRATRYSARKLLGIADSGLQGQIHVSTSEEDAEVSVDGVPAGKTPLRPLVGIKPGARHVQVTKSGFVDWVGDVFVDPGETTAVWVDLKERPVRWYQLWWVWSGLAAGASVVSITVVLVLAAGAAAALGAAYAINAPARPARGTANID